MTRIIHTVHTQTYNKAKKSNAKIDYRVSAYRRRNPQVNQCEIEACCINVVHLPMLSQHAAHAWNRIEKWQNATLSEWSEVKVTQAVRSLTRAPTLITPGPVRRGCILWSLSRCMARLWQAQLLKTARAQAERDDRAGNVAMYNATAASWAGSGRRRPTPIDARRRGAKHQSRREFETIFVFLSK